MWTRSCKCIKSVQLIRRLTEQRKGSWHLSGGVYSGQARSVSQDKEISHDQESMQSNSTACPQNKKRRNTQKMTKVHETHER